MNTTLSFTSRAIPTVVAAFSILCGGSAFAETSLAKGDGWELFAAGRVNVFHSYARGEAFPVRTYDDMGNVLHEAKGGGLAPGDAAASRPPPPDAAGQQLSPGTIESSRIRSGFLSNVFGFGVRHELTPYTRVTAYMSIWAIVESEARRKYFPVPADVREGFMKFEGPWGSLLAGRSLTLFSRGATEIDFMYAHGFGLGYPGSVDVSGPTAGQIGFGVLANGFAAGIVYTTPKLAGLQLAVGYYDPSNLAGSQFERTRFGRPEAELTFDVPLGNIGRIHLFGNGGWQKVYQRDSTKDATVYGAGYGGRFEVGRVHLGLAGHFGKGLGLYYALEPSLATYSEDGGELRNFKGYYGQLQVVVGKFDFAAGAGMTQVDQLANDKLDNRDNDTDPATPSSNDDADPNTNDPPANSYIKRQVGINAGIVYHINSYMAVDIDYFRADFAWWLGEKQGVNFINTGITMLW